MWSEVLRGGQQSAGVAREAELNRKAMPIPSAATLADAHLPPFQSIVV